ncbi:MAG TPA: hypothetical protein VHY08_01895 [Bacillota bacterium]|nr:hypothetical protein [Bacillota bacterium]
MTKEAKSEILEVKYVAVMIEPEAMYVIAEGTARSNATHPRLVQRPSLPGIIELDFQADPGRTLGLTKVKARFPLHRIGGLVKVTIYSETTKITISIR